MEVTFFLPGHPGYFDNEYSQAEINSALATLRRLTGRSEGVRTITPTWSERFVLLREPGRAIGFKITGGEPGPRGVAESLAPDSLRRIVANIRNLLAGQRGNYSVDRLSVCQIPDNL